MLTLTCFGLCTPNQLRVGGLQALRKYMFGMLARKKCQLKTLKFNLSRDL